MLLAILRIELGTHIGERLGLARLDLLELEDVIAELRFHGRGDVADLHREQRVAERTGEILLLHEAELAALARGGVARIFLRELGEILAGARLGGHAFGLLERRGIVVAVHRDDDVARAAALVEHVVGAIVVVELLQIGLGGRDLRGELFEAQLGVLQRHRLGGHEAIAVLVVVGLDRGVVDRLRAGELLGRELRVLHFALLVLEIEQALRFGARQEVGAADALLQLVDQQLRARARRRIRASDLLRLCEHRPRGGGVVLAVRALELRECSGIRRARVASLTR